MAAMATLSSSMISMTASMVTKNMTTTTSASAADCRTGADTAIEVSALKYRLRPIRRFHC